MVTGSHIPFDRNGLKFYRPEGEITKADEAGILAARDRARPGSSAGRCRAGRSGRTRALSHPEHRLSRPGRARGSDDRRPSAQRRRAGSDRGRAFRARGKDRGAWPDRDVHPRRYRSRAARGRCTGAGMGRRVRPRRPRDDRRRRRPPSDRGRAGRLPARRHRGASDRAHPWGRRCRDTDFVKHRARALGLDHDHRPYSHRLAFRHRGAGTPRR
jgi:hypothetical protein